MKRPAWVKAWRVQGIGKTQGEAPVLLKTSSIWSRLSRVGVACTHVVCPRSVSSHVDGGYMAMVGPGPRAGTLLLASQT